MQQFSHTGTLEISVAIYSANIAHLPAGRWHLHDIIQVGTVKLGFMSSLTTDRIVKNCLYNWGFELGEQVVRYIRPSALVIGSQTRLWLGKPMSALFIHSPFQRLRSGTDLFVGDFLRGAVMIIVRMSKGRLLEGFA